MISKIIKIGDKLDITDLRRKDGEVKEESEGVYKSMVYDILDDQKIIISMPFIDSKMILLSLNQRYDICFYSNDSLYRAEGIIHERYKTENRYELVVELTTGLRRVQRREYFRLHDMFDMDYRILDDEEEENVENLRELYENVKEEMESNIRMEDYISSVVIDISGGGLRFIAPVRYERGDFLAMRLYMDMDGQTIEMFLLGKIRNSKEVMNRIRQFEIRVEFVGIPEDVREKIIQHIFREERKLRKKGKS